MVKIIVLMYKMAEKWRFLSLSLFLTNLVADDSVVILVAHNPLLHRVHRCHSQLLRMLQPAAVAAATAAAATATAVVAVASLVASAPRRRAWSIEGLPSH